ncbi:putative addiction module component (TIGR02574 family) [Pelomonas aquatica]|uniref:Addiction module component (TIGR02574 family) n=1 Tax=Pelomonas aquatica TaxID=431058 RepID=A0ABU1ZDB0_9BURK|nr:addiction module protein [Pelomonas aquatica]MDR7298604.1 putative addiction module component (TIGR02574 family) [Pelomonas aquatica]
MHDQVADLVQKGRLLPPEERERLVDGLLESLNEAASSALDPAWEAEIEKRLAEYDRGEVQAIDGEAVFAKARKLVNG